MLGSNKVSGDCKESLDERESCGGNTDTSCGLLLASTSVKSVLLILKRSSFEVCSAIWGDSLRGTSGKGHLSMSDRSEFPVTGDFLELTEDLDS